MVEEGDIPFIIIERLLAKFVYSYHSRFCLFLNLVKAVSVNPFEPLVQPNCLNTGLSSNECGDTNVGLTLSLIAIKSFIDIKGVVLPT